MSKKELYIVEVNQISYVVLEHLHVLKDQYPFCLRGHRSHFEIVIYSRFSSYRTRKAKQKFTELLPLKKCIHHLKNLYFRKLGAR